MNIAVIGAGNSGLAMAAHLSGTGNRVTLWNRSRPVIAKKMATRTIHCQGVINGSFEIEAVTDDLDKAIKKNTDVILITTPASSHRELAKQIAGCIKDETLIVLNPGRTFGALEFREVYESYNRKYRQTIAETQTIIYTCRKTCEDAVNIIAMKSDVLISTFDANENEKIIARLPAYLRQYFIPAKSMIETSLGNVGMILHCAPLLLNTGWTENQENMYKHYYDGITPSVGKFIEKIDEEKVQVSRELGLEVETTKEWLQRTYGVRGDTLYECIHNNDVYKNIDAPASLNHRYIFEDIPCGLVPLEAIGKKLGFEMKHTGLIIDLAIALTDVDFRREGRNLSFFCRDKKELKEMFRTKNTG